MSNLLVAADMLEEQGIRCVRRFGSMQTNPMKCGHDAFELQQGGFGGDGIDVSKELLYVAYMFNEFGGIERKLVIDCGRRECRFRLLVKRSGC